MSTDLIENFPHQRSHRVVRFAVMSQLYIVEHNWERHNVARHELWYTESDYHQMRLAAATRKHLALLRAQRSSVSFTKNQMKSLADERRQNVLLSLEPNIILPIYPVQYVTEICNRMSRAS